MGNAGPAGAAATATGLASAAAAAAEHAAKTIKGVDRHAAALYLSMKGLYAVPPLLAFSCLKTLDLSRNTLSEYLTRCRCYSSTIVSGNRPVLLSRRRTCPRSGEAVGRRVWSLHRHCWTSFPSEVGPVLGFASWSSVV